MAYVQPSTNIVLIKNCILQKSVNDETDTLYFETKELQTRYFDGLGNKVEYSPTTYQNMGQGVMRIGKTMKQLYGCNYMYFTNSGSYTDNGSAVDTPFEGKRYYCFIDRLKYINNNCTEVYYSIDYIQTFMFDYDEKTCLVERMTTADDDIGKYIMDEGMGFGELEVDKTKTYYFNTWQYLTVYSSKDTLPVNSVKINNVDSAAKVRVGVYIDAQEGTSTSQPFMAKWFFLLDTETTGFVMDGKIPMVLTVVKGATVYSVKEVTSSETVLNNDGVYYNFTSAEIKQLPGTDDEAGRITGKQCFGILYYGDSIVDQNGYSYSDKALENNNMLFNNIINAQAIPTSFRGTSDAQGRHTYYYTNDTYASMVKPNRSISNSNHTETEYGMTSFGDYTPKNNKLFTYPYVSLILSSTEGNSVEYKFERFDNDAKASFGLVACGLPTPICNVYPVDYNGNQNVYDSLNTELLGHKSLELGIALTEFPMIPIKIDEYKKYLENNRYRNNLGMVNAYLSVGTSIADFAGFIAAPTPSGLLATAKSVTTAIGKFQELGKKQELAKRTPPSYIGQIGTADLTMTTGQCGYRLTTMRIKEEFARMIDAYFTRYGYKIVSHVDLNNQRKLRTEFTFIKTVECNLSISNSMAQEDENAIENIYNNGVRFWVNPAHYKDYSVTNSLLPSNNQS